MADCGIFFDICVVFELETNFFFRKLLPVGSLVGETVGLLDGNNDGLNVGQEVVGEILGNTLG